MPAAITNFADVTATLTAALAARFGFGKLLGIFNHSVTANRQDGPYTSIDSVEAAGFTAAAEPEVHAWASAVFNIAAGIDQIVIGREDGGDADYTATVTAVHAADPESYYYVNIESRTDADILLVAAFYEARRKYFVAQSSDADILSDGAGNIAEDLEGLLYHRTSLYYHSVDDSLGGPVPTNGYLDGAISSAGGGFNLDNPNGVGIWAYQSLPGITRDDVTETEAANVYSNNANLYGTNLALSFTSKGTSASGRFTDQQTTLDWTEVRLEENILSLFVGVATKVPYSNAGILQVGNAHQSVFDAGINNGHYLDEPTLAPTLSLPDVTTISQAARILRELTVTGAATQAGAIQKVITTINLSP